MVNKKKLFTSFIEFKKELTFQKDVSEILLSYKTMTIVDIKNALSSLNFSTEQIYISLENIERETLPCFVIAKEDINSFCKVNDLLIYNYNREDDYYYLINDEEKEKRITYKKIKIKYALMVKKIDETAKNEEMISYNVPKDYNSWIKSIKDRFRSNINIFYFLTFVITINTLAIPIFIIFIYDNYLPSKDLRNLENATIGILLFLVLDFALRNIRSNVISWTLNRVNYLLQSLTMKKITSLADKTLEKLTKKSNYFEDINQTTQFYNEPIITLLSDAVFAPLLLIPALVISWKMTIPLLFLIPLYWITYRIIQAKLQINRNYYDISSTRKRDLTNELKRRSDVILIESILPVFNYRLSSDTASAALHAQRCQMIRHQHELVFYIFAFLGISASLTIGLLELRAGEITTGSLLAYLYIASFIFIPTYRFLSKRRKISSTKTLLSKLHDFFLTKSEKRSYRSLESLYLKNLDIKFSKVNFISNITSEVLFNDVDLTIKHGRIYGIYSNTNIKNSSFLKLINKTYIPQHGSITIGDIDHRQFDTLYLRQRLLTLDLTRSLLKNMSIYENIKYINPLIRRRELLISMEVFGVADMLRDNDIDIDTPISGEDNYRLTKELYAIIILLIPFTTRAKFVLIENIPTNLINKQLPMLKKFLNMARDNFTVIFNSDHREMLANCDNIICLTENAKVYCNDKEIVMNEIENSLAV